MKNLSKQLLAAGLLAAFAAAAGAQTAPAPAAGHDTAMMGHRHGDGMRDPAKMRERMERRMAERQALLKQKLQITSAQEGAWNTWTQATKPPANMQRPNREEFAKLTTPERNDRMRQLRAQRQAEMDKRADATKAFYAQLTPEQKKVFDSEGARFGRGGHHGRHHG
jgi:hypothetical protein